MGARAPGLRTGLARLADDFERRFLVEFLGQGHLKEIELKSSATERNLASREALDVGSLWQIRFIHGTPSTLGYRPGTLLYILFVHESDQQRIARRLAEGPKWLQQVDNRTQRVTVKNEESVYDLLCAFRKLIDSDGIACADQGLSEYRIIGDTIEFNCARVLQAGRHVGSVLEWVSCNCWQHSASLKFSYGTLK